MERSSSSSKKRRGESEQGRESNFKKRRGEAEQERESDSKKRRGEGEQDRASSGERRLDVVPVGAEVLDCPICYSPLEPPILQCPVGHFICSPCHALVKDDKCHSCRDYTYSFERCYGMERVVESAKKRSNSNKRNGGQQEMERESSGERLDVVSLDTEVLDCPSCHRPLRPPILQCRAGHFVCSRRCAMLLDNECRSCRPNNPSLERCYGMEHVVESAMVPCSNGRYGCTATIAYYQKEEHEYMCPNRGPCFCPKSACSFMGSVATLLDHLTMQHGWPSTTFSFRKWFDIHGQPGMHVLRTRHGHCFLLSITLLESTGHAISVTCVQPYETKPEFGYVLRAPHRDGYESSYVEITSSSLSDGLPTGYDFTIAQSKVYHEELVFRMTIYD